MNRRGFIAWVSGLLGSLPFIGKAKAEPIVQPAVVGSSDPVTVYRLWKDPKRLTNSDNAYEQNSSVWESVAFCNLKRGDFIEFKNRDFLIAFDANHVGDGVWEAIVYSHSSVANRVLRSDWDGNPDNVPKLPVTV